MALSTTDLGKEGGGLPKTFAPGNHALQINSVYLEDFKFIPDAEVLLTGAIRASVKNSFNILYSSRESYVVGMSYMNRIFIVHFSHSIK